MININRYNYETFFLLYVDGELSATEKQAVEQFAREHPDLATELDMLQQALLLPDEPILFADKNSLYKTTEGINLSNYEEQFLCYVDNELNPAEKKEVETFVLQHPELQDGFTLLKQTRLEPGTILFPNKQSLYRPAKKERPVIYVRWWRIAAAATVIGLGVMVWLLLPDHNKASGDLAGNQPVKQPVPSKIAAPAESNRASLQAIEDNQRTGNTSPLLAINDRTGSTTIKTTTQRVTAAVGSDKSRKEDPARLIAKTETTLPDALKRGDDREITPVTQLAEPTASIKRADITNSAHTAANNIAGNNLMQPAVYKELNTDAADENKSLYLGSVEINKDKLRGLFRKASSIFRGRPARQEEERTDSRDAEKNGSLE